jgi:hypothetical protein
LALSLKGVTGVLKKQGKRPACLTVRKARRPEAAGASCSRQASGTLALLGFHVRFSMSRAMADYGKFLLENSSCGRAVL